MRILSRRKKGTEFGRVAITGEGSLVFEPRGQRCGVFAFFFCSAKSFEGAFAVVIQRADGRYLAQPPHRVRFRSTRLRRSEISRSTSQRELECGES